MTITDYRCLVVLIETLVSIYDSLREIEQNRRNSSDLTPRGLESCSIVEHLAEAARPIRRWTKPITAMLLDS